MPYLCVCACTWCHRGSLDLALCGRACGWLCSRGVEWECVVGFGCLGRAPSRYGRGGGGGPRWGARGEGPHLNGQVLCAGQATAAEQVIRVSVHQQQPGAVGHLTDTVHHLQGGERSDKEAFLKTNLNSMRHYVHFVHLNCPAHTIFCCMTKTLSESHYTRLSLTHFSTPSFSPGKGKSGRTGIELIVCASESLCASPGF